VTASKWQREPQGRAGGVAGDGGSLADLQLRGFFAAYGWRQSPRRVSDDPRRKSRTIAAPEPSAGAQDQRCEEKTEKCLLVSSVGPGFLIGLWEGPSSSEAR